ncbi:IQ motif and SEC7 domain-containing protein 2 [Thelohanellus kitauei]|uniref:IQ motif and SEC7 domain-containing protein 2 n=1 Tax=Thelohanellus kitauei TaxID=669202 RepID=A0A0C2JFN5_THEKT|nr:IQ motif and SEC7 domain-containing protein 2 [Thelohanellus kitauei]
MNYVLEAFNEDDEWLTRTNEFSSPQHLDEEKRLLNSIHIHDLTFENVVDQAYHYVISITPKTETRKSYSSSGSTKSDCPTSHNGSEPGRITLDRQKLLATLGCDLKNKYIIHRSRSNSVSLTTSHRSASLSSSPELINGKLSSTMSLNDVKGFQFFADLDIFTRIGINIFNMHPNKGLAYFMTCSSILKDPIHFSSFVRDCGFLNQSKIGEFFGCISIDFNKEALQYLAAGFEHRGVDLETAYRKFHLCLKLPGEAQKIEKILQAFADEYFKDNQESSGQGFMYESSDTIMVLLYAMTMLNVDLHNPSVKKKMTKEDFIKNVYQSEFCRNLTVTLLENIYDSIAKNGFIAGTDNVTPIRHVAHPYNIKNPFFICEHRQFISSFDIKTTKAYHQRDSYKPRVLLLFNDCAIIYKMKRKTIKKGLSPVCKGIFRFLNTKIYPLNNPQYPRLFVVPHACFYVDTDYMSDKILEFLKKFMFEVELTHSIMSKISESVFRDSTTKYKEPKETFDEFMNELKDNVFGRYYKEMKTLRE